VLPSIAASMSSVQENWFERSGVIPASQGMTQRNNVTLVDRSVRLIKRHPLHQGA
jgi:hypothetical protein